tara:strand:- start:504 stop:896 length:393 start_codon:yes stop_codon:yes gene_type:complete
MPHPTTTFAVNDALDTLVEFESMLDDATEPNTPKERVISVAVAGSILVNRTKRLPYYLFSSIERNFIDIIETRIVHLLSEFGDSPSDVSDAETRPYPEEDDRGTFPPEYPKNPYDMDDDEWNRESNWGCF